MKTKLKSLGIKVSELARYLEVSRPTLYKYINYFDLREFNSLNAKIKKIFDYIINEKTTSKLNVINYISKINNDNGFDDISDLEQLLESDPNLKSEIKEVVDRNREKELIRVNEKLAETIEKNERIEALLQASFESFNDTLIFSIDIEYRYLYFNTVHKNVMKSFYGSDIEIGMNILDCITIKKDLSLAKSNYDLALSGESHTVIADTVSTEGQIRYFESFFSPIYSHENKIIGATVFARDITPRINNLKSLESNEKKISLSALRYQQVFLNLEIGVVFHNGDSSIIESNERACELLGLSQDMMMGMNAKDVYGKLINENLKTISATEYPVNRVVLSRKKVRNMIVGVFNSNHSDPLWLLVNGTPLFNELGEIHEIIITFSDITARKKEFITEHKQLVEQLKQNEKDLLKSQAIAHLGTWRLDVKTNEVVWTEELYKMYGFDPKLPVPNYTEHMKLFTPESWERLSSALELTRTQGVPYELELETVTKDGSNGWMWVRGEAEKDTGGKIIAIWGAAQDITEQKKILDQLKQKEKNLLEAQKIAKIGSWRLDVNTNKVEWTEELYKMYGLDPTHQPPDLIEQKKLFTQESWERLSNSINLAISKGIPYELEVQTLKSDYTIGWMWTRAEIEKNINDEIIAIHGVAQDITERKLVLDQLKRKEKQLLDSQSISQVGSFRLDLITNETEWTDEVYKMFSVDPTLPAISFEEQMKTYTKESWEKLTSAVDLTAKKGIGYALELEIVRQDGSHGWIWVKGEAEKDKYGKIVAILGVAQDITERKEQEKKLYEATCFDKLTGLYNRTQLIKTLNEINMEKKPRIGMIIFDIDNLKLLNSHFDASVGDEALMVAAKTLKQYIKDDDMLFRFGGDEFAVILKNTDIISLKNFARKISLDFSNQIISGISMTLSFGITILDPGIDNIQQIMIDAEEDLFRYKSVHMNSSHFSVLKMILGFLTEKFHYEKLHSEFVGMMSAKLGEHLLLSKDEIDELSVAGMFHDIGKITIPDEILNKPGKLTAEEYEIIKRHSVISHNIIESAIPYSKLHKVILHHHERFDGNGYPEGLKGDDIPFLSRILCVVDAYEAMTSNRVYRKKMSKGEAIEELKRFKGIQFDPTITDAFIEILLNKKEGDLVD